MSGGAGNDTYVFSPNDGPGLDDVVSDSSGSLDGLVFDPPGALYLTAETNGDLTITIDGDVGKVTVVGHYAGTPVETITADFGFDLGTHTYALSASTITGTAGDDAIAGLAGSANGLSGLGGNDVLFGQESEDILNGGAGNDVLYGGGANDVLAGQGDDDVLVGGAAEDHLEGGAGSDLLIGGGGNDTYRFRASDGDAQADQIEDSDGGADSIEVEEGIAIFAMAADGDDLEIEFNQSSVLVIKDHYGAGTIETLTYDFGDGARTYNLSAGHGAGTTGDDVIVGLIGAADSIVAGDGDDVLVGQSDSSEVLNGGIGNDLLISGGGIDSMTGGLGNDTFAYRGPNDGIAVATDTQFAGQATQIADFASAEDSFAFFNEAFGFDAGTEGLLSDIEGELGQTIFSTVSNYDGTLVEPNATRQFVYDPTNSTLYYDDDVTSAGYTVIAQLQTGAAVTASNIEISDFKVTVGT